MKDKIIGIGLAIVLASGIYLSVFGAGEGASQKWVDQQVNFATTNLENRVSARLDVLAAELSNTMSRIDSVLMNTNDTNSIAKAIEQVSVSTAPIANTLLQQSFTLAY